MLSNQKVTGGGVGLDQSQIFPKVDFPTKGRGQTGGQDVWDKFQNFAFFLIYGFPKRADQLSKTFQTLSCLPINCLLNLYVLKIGC